jgi:diacylglycerol O-acyltransferase / wax synthase
MASTRMSTADVAWLHMDRPTNNMVVNGVMWFDEPVDWERLRQVYEERFLAPYPKFRQKVVEPPLSIGRLRWEDDPAFDLDQHLIPVRLPAPGDRTALHTYVSQQMSRPLDRDRPLWEVHQIDGYNGGSAVFHRIHHCVADGISLIRLLLSMTDDQPDETLFLPPELDTPGRDRSLKGRARGLVSDAVKVSGQLAHEGMEVLTKPSRAVQLAELVSAGTTALGKDLFLSPDYRTVLKGQMGRNKHAMWSDPFDLAAVKAIGRAHGATVNDVVCTAVTGALRSYLEHRGSLTEEVRALVPFNLRPLDEPLPRNLGNKFGIVFLPLPVGLEDRGARLGEIKRRMDAIKNSAEGVVAYGILSVIGMTPVQIEKVIVDLFASKGSLVLTNVPGPAKPVYLAGTRVAGVMGWVPASGGVAVGMSIFSYDGEVTVGVTADARLIPDPERLVEAFNTELAALLTEEHHPEWHVG